MNILFIGYWSVQDGLSEATIKPHLEILSQMNQVHKIFYVSLERTINIIECDWDIPKIEFVPYYSPPKRFLLDKFNDFTALPKKLVALCRAKSIDNIICRSSLAGAIGYNVWRELKIPYYVESFEPHADYMVESKVWSKWGLRYNIQRYFERKQKLTASALMTVSENYKKHLINHEEVKCPVEVIPCSVDTDRFKFDIIAREKIRKQLKIQVNTIVGIYVGKFGGIYYDRVAFDFVKSCFDKVENFFLLILTTDLDVHEKLESSGCPMGKCWIGQVAHELVPDYLSAADIAFNFHRTSLWSMALSPIKNGEYWANGLPIIISEGIGDDSDIIKKCGVGGVVVEYANQSLDVWGYLKMTNWLRTNTDKNDNVALAKNYRNNEGTLEKYHELLL